MISYLYEAKDYNRMIDDAKTVDDLISGLEKLSPFADDALKVAKTMTLEDFEKYREWLKLERKGIFGGIENVIKYGAILIPVLFIDAHFLQEQCHAPLGTCLIRMLEVKGDSYIKERQAISTRQSK